jgi:hypothetical protein
MAKSVHDDVLDGALNIVKNNATRQVACSAEPTTYTEGNATYALADITVASGDFTAANGSTSGRKLTVGAKTGALIDASGTATTHRSAGRHRHQVAVRHNVHQPGAHGQRQQHRELSELEVRDCGPGMSMNPKIDSPAAYG